MHDQPFPRHSTWIDALALAPEMAAASPNCEVPVPAHDTCPDTTTVLCVPTTPLAVAVKETAAPPGVWETLGGESEGELVEAVKAPKVAVLLESEESVSVSVAGCAGHASKAMALQARTEWMLPPLA